MGALTHNGEVLQNLPADASQINFDKTGTDLNSTQTENAIKEVNTKVNTNTEDIDKLKSGLTNLIKSATITATTDTSGNVKLTTDYIKIVGVYAYPTLSPGVMCRVRPFWLNNPAPETYQYNGTYLEVTTTEDSLVHVKETEVTGIIYYI